jgi:hypothetical protein
VKNKKRYLINSSSALLESIKEVSKKNRKERHSKSFVPGRERTTDVHASVVCEWVVGSSSEKSKREREREGESSEKVHNTADKQTTRKRARHKDNASTIRSRLLQRGTTAIHHELQHTS